MVRFLSKRTEEADNQALETAAPEGEEPAVCASDARDIMIRRNDMTAIEAGMTLEECVKCMMNDPLPAFPVYEDNVDAILGVISGGDAVREYVERPASREKPVSTLPGLIREAAIIPETRPVVSIFRYMKAQKTRIMIVVDEYGQTAGIVTYEAALEEIAGCAVPDARDDELVLCGSGNSVVLDGMTPLDRAGAVLGCDFGTEDYQTLSGYLTSLLGHVPDERDRSVSGAGFLFHILKTGNHTIKKVRAERLPE